MKMNNKVLAMYQAVVELLEEGVDITLLKVADITQKAGIGKGTAYEYFSSKEEIIAKALYWDLLKQLEGIEEGLHKASSMKEQIFTGLNWIEENVHRKSMILQFTRASQKKGTLPMQGSYECMQEEDMWSKICHLCDIVLKTGEQEGKVSPLLPDHMKYYILISNSIGFFMMLNPACGILPEEPAELKQHIYEVMLKSLQ